MTTTTTEVYFYPNKIGRILFLSMEEILGRNGLNAVLNLSNLQQYLRDLPPDDMDMQFEFETLSRMQVAMEQLYGVRGGLGLALRTGRAFTKYGLIEFGLMMGFNDLSFRLLPASMKLRVGAETFARTLTNLTDQVVEYAEEKERVLWIIERCPICWGRTTDHTACHLAVGILQEALVCLSGGRYYHIEEIECVARGDSTCTIAIDKEPLV